VNAQGRAWDGSRFSSIVHHSAFIALCLCAASAFAAAPSYPVRPIRLLIGFPPGGAADILGRIAAQQLTMSLGEQVVADNRGGAGSVIATAIAARAAPDGYTLLFTSLSTWGITNADAKRLTYSPEKDFTPLAIVGSSANPEFVYE